MRYNSRVFSLLGQGGAIFGVSLLEQMKLKKNLLVLSADMSTTAGLDKFKTQYSESFINAGIAEMNMIGMASGLSDEGYKTISVTQACFVSMRDFEAVRQYCGYMGKKQIIIGIGSGFTLTFLGNTHYALEDIALMRSIPGMTIIVPADAMEAVKAFEAALEIDAPTYIRLYGGTNIPILFKDDFEYKIGKAIQLKEGKDIQIIATGSRVSTALTVAENFEKEGISASVIDMHTIKPLDTNSIDMNVHLLVSVEEHFKIGGLGTAISDYLAGFSSHPKLLKIGVEDKFSVVGDYDYLIDQNGLSEEKIYKTIKENM